MTPILLGMNNPISSDPCHALFPSPEGCTGPRIWEMLHARTGASRSQYLHYFDRRNLVPGEVWSAAQAREHAAVFLRQVRDTGRTVVVLGAEPRDALKLPPLLVKPLHRDGVIWRQLPHPSGRNLWYNAPGNREMAELLLEELYRQSGRLL